MSPELASKFQSWMWELLLWLLTVAFAVGVASATFATKDYVDLRMEALSKRVEEKLDKQAADRKGQLDKMEQSLIRIEQRLYEHMEKKP